MIKNASILPLAASFAIFLCTEMVAPTAEPSAGAEAKRAAAADESPTGLLCNLLSHPEKSVITDAQPDFGWIVNSSLKDDVQSAYQILVASSKEIIGNSQGDMWDSGKVDSNQSINILYAGKPLQPNSSYWWRVRTWNKKGEPSPYSAVQRFNTGEFGAARKWPGESRWTQVPDESGGKSWGFENRHPISYHEAAPVKQLRRNDGVYFIDFGRAAFATLKMTVAWEPKDARQATTITVFVGEKNKGEAIDRKPGGGIIFDKFPLPIQKGKRSYTLQLPRFVPRYPHSQAMPAHMPEVIPFRYCEVVAGPDEITIEDPRQLGLYYEFNDAAASFSCSNKPLNDIYELCKYSVKANTFNGDYAASQRERMLYEADTYIHQMCHYALDREYAIQRYSLENMIYHASWPTEWISHSIFMSYADYIQTGNVKSLARCYAEIKPKTMLALAREDGLISTRTGLQTKEFLSSIHFNGKALKDIVDWPTTESDGYVFKDYNTVVNAFHYHSLVLMSELAAALGKTQDADLFRARAEKMKAAINTKMWDATRGLYVDGIGTEHSSLHANMFPLAFGLVPEERKKTVAAFIKSRGMACSVYPSGYLLDALYDAGEDEYALSLLTSETDRSWLNMIRVGSTMTTEAWDIKYKGNSGWSHAWSASPAHIIPRKLMGIEPLAPGFGKVLIQPRPGGLASARVTMPTIRGPVSVSFENIPKESFSMRVDIPANVSARIGVPALGNPSPSVVFDGKPIDGRIQGNYVFVEPVGSGTHVLMRASASSSKEPAAGKQ